MNTQTASTNTEVAKHPIMVLLVEEALYRAKDAGRNRVSVASAPTA